MALPAMNHSIKSLTNRPPQALGEFSNPPGARVSNTGWRRSSDARPRIVRRTRWKRRSPEDVDNQGTGVLIRYEAGRDARLRERVRERARTRACGVAGGLVLILMLILILILVMIVVNI